MTREQLRAATASVLREGKENDSNWSGAVTRELSSTPSQVINDSVIDERANVEFLFRNECKTVLNSEIPTGMDRNKY